MVEGRQELRKPPVYGQKLTDQCSVEDDSVHLLDALADLMRTRRRLSREEVGLNSLARLPKGVMIGPKG